MSPEPYYSDEHVQLFHGDCLDVLRELPDASVDAVVTDPPYGLEFMGREWDSFGGGRAQGSRGGAGDRGILPGYGRGGTSEDRFAFRQKSSRAFGEWCEQWATECLRVLKPGGHLLAFGGSRTWHRLASAVEDAGFEIRDSIAWLYGSGFPKSLDVSKAIDKRRDWSLVERLSGEIRRARAEAGLSLAEIGQATLDATDGTYGKWYHRGGHMFFETGRSLPSRPEWDHLRHVLPIAPEFVEVYDEAEREVTGQHGAGNPIGIYEFKHGEGKGRTANERRDIPATPDAERWQGWGTALKPAFEPIVVGRKPLAGTVAANVLAHGTGALNIDACRVQMSAADAAAIDARHAGMDVDRYERAAGSALNLSTNPIPLKAAQAHDLGRWPTNVILDESQAVELDRQTGVLTSGGRSWTAGQEDTGAWRRMEGRTTDGRRASDYERGGDSGGASRFFPTFRYEAKAPTSERPRAGEVVHPTVKPLDLMRWLVRLVTPPGGTVLEPFAGSGTTAEACVVEGFRCIAIEREADYLPLIVGRLTKPIEMVLDLTGGAA